jgi:hypothetical protein
VCPEKNQLGQGVRCQPPPVFIVGSAFAMSACSNSSGVLKMGPDTFSISTEASSGKGGVPAAKRIAYKEAGDECASRGLEVFVLNERSAGTTLTDGMAKSELTFRCLRSDDPEFKRQRFEKTPDLVIENRQKN